MEGMEEVATYECSGTAWMDMAGNKQGTYLGHVLAGTALLVWALHWNVAVFRSWLTQSKTRAYRSQPTWALPFLPDAWPVEAVLKVLVPLAAILVNMIGPDGWRHDMCGEHEPRAGHFNPEVIFYFANVWALFAFLLSGLVDLLAIVVELPNGSQHFFTAVGFLMQGFLLSQAQYGSMMAGNSYYLLYLMSMATALALLLEVAFPTSFFVSCGRVYATYLQAIWFFNLSFMMYSGSPMWDSQHPLPDMAPAAFVPVPFVFWMNVLSITMFSIYAGMAWLLGHPSEDVIAANMTTPAPPPVGYHSPGGRTGAKTQGYSEMVPLVARH